MPLAEQTLRHGAGDNEANQCEGPSHFLNFASVSPLKRDLRFVMVISSGIMMTPL